MIQPRALWGFLVLRDFFGLFFQCSHALIGHIRKFDVSCR
jgi:hypothetical protein